MSIVLFPVKMFPTHASDFLHIRCMVLTVTYYFLKLHCFLSMCISLKKSTAWRYAILKSAHIIPGVSGNMSTLYYHTIIHENLSII